MQLWFYSPYLLPCVRYVRNLNGGIFHCILCAAMHIETCNKNGCDCTLRCSPSCVFLAHVTLNIAVKSVRVRSARSLVSDQDRATSAESSGAACLVPATWKLRLIQLYPGSTVSFVTSVDLWPQHPVRCGPSRCLHQYYSTRQLFTDYRSSTVVTRCL
jgi:hypothetical protein